MLIRPVRTADADAVAVLLGQLGYPQHEGVAARLEAWHADPSSAAFAPESEDGVLGVIAVHVCPYFERPGAWGRIVALVVAETARGQGVGARLVAAAESFAAARGCERMEVTSNDRRADAHAFYEARGYTVQNGRSSRFLRDLDAPGPGTPGLSGPAGAARR
ncbi:Ribosomal protein S18 acetylase RimI [Glycomyces sambucus]|uniref:Ribosomal protein S18 acetylase RimI n=1 Tax=Glycomyces sambucus TaxID=380244 RepID=A0A1G9LY85_9ACTN|nr:GNAT family N-acetyltransferase [Glycomyces sambucus]SDL66385.1 Ribosomal protein S18 acetylase RimI [Glycomyces sambucus]